MNLNDIKHNFATNLIKLRKSRKLNQIELGEAIHYSSKAISKWENEETMPAIEVLVMIGDFFGVTVDELISSKDVVKKSYRKRNHFFIALSSSLLPFVLAILVFSFLYISSIDKSYLAFLCGGIVSAITLIVLTSIWYTKKIVYCSINYLLVCLMLLGMIITNFEFWWIFLLVAISLSILFFVFFMIKFSAHKKPKNPVNK